MLENINYDALKALDAVISCGGFLKAASSLHVTQSAISQRIKFLEDHFGAPLISRTTPPAVTALGRKLLTHLHSVKLLENDLSEHLGEEKQSALSTLLIGVNADSLATWFLDALSPLINEQKIQLELIVENEDLTNDLLQRGEVFGCISSASQAPTGCESVRLGSMHYVCVATPDFKKRFFSKGFNSGAAKTAPAVLFNRDDWVHTRFLEKIMDWDVTFPRHYVPSSEGFFDMIARGLTYGVPPLLQAKDLIKKGKLVNLAPGKTIEVPLSWHYLRRETSAQKALRLMLIKQSKSLLQI